MDANANEANQNQVLSALNKDLFGADDESGAEGWDQENHLLKLSGNSENGDDDDKANRSSKVWIPTMPVEEDVLVRHTKWPRLWFKTLLMERVFMDGQARLHEKLVYLGYAFIVFASFLFGTTTLLLQAYQRGKCGSEESGFPEDGLCEINGTYIFDYHVGEGSPAYSGAYFFTFLFPALVAISAVGCCLQFTIHRTKRVKEKSWAMLAIFLLLLVYILFVYSMSVERREGIWPEIMRKYTFLLLPVCILLFGLGFKATFLIAVLNMVICVAAYAIASKSVSEAYGSDSVSAAMLGAYFRFDAMWMALLSFFYLVGSYLDEVANRKEFLQRLFLNNQQVEIINERTKNENLQKRLLQSMLPLSIVSQLQRQDFSVSSWNQLRALSHRHFGVSILFAELDNFTTLSSRVTPSQVIQYLNELFFNFDELCDQHDVYKVETFGDRYIAAVGVVSGQVVKEGGSDNLTCCLSNASSLDSTSIREAARYNTAHIIDFAQAIIKRSSRVTFPETAGACPLLRIGVHTGPCMSGIIGARNFRFTVYGDTMNTAARMEQHGLPLCIHTTQDVVDLAPGHSWEKLKKKIEMKGKGSMQTYVLRPSPHPLENGNDSDSDGVSAVYQSAGVGSLHFMHGEEEEEQHEESKGEEEGETGGYTPVLKSILSGVSPWYLVTLDEVYSKHTKGFGLFFKKLHIERAFLDRQARLYRNSTYLGHTLYAFFLLYNLLGGYLAYQFQTNLCSKDADPSFAYICLAHYGQDVYDKSQLSQDVTIQYSDIINSSLFRMTPAIGAVLAALILCGCLSHWFIHRSKIFREKSWALLNAWVFYVANLIISISFIILARLPDDTQVLWPWNISFMVLIQSTLLLFLTGAPFTLNLLWWIIESIVYYGLTLPVVLRGQAVAEEKKEYMPILATHFYIKLSLFLFWYGVIILLGSYFKDITSRKRFLQRILMHRQKSQIIRSKSMNVSMQRNFLNNFLPSNAVAELRIAARQNKLTSSSFGKLQSLSKSHVGVSMLFADLVGFTAFSAQVDPFKVMVFLNELFQRFDKMCDEYNVYKVETVGDCYVATVGLVTGALACGEAEVGHSHSGKKERSTSAPVVSESEASVSVCNARDMVGFAKAMLVGSRTVLKPDLNTPATMRIGIHTGSCISGIVGSKRPKLTLLGELVVRAAHLEKWGTPDCIHTSREMADLVPEEPWLENKNKIGKTYLLRV